MMFIELTDAISGDNILINKNHILAVRPRKEVEPYGLINVTEIETATTRMYVTETYKTVKYDVNNG